MGQKQVIDIKGLDDIHYFYARNLEKGAGIGGSWAFELLFEIFEVSFDVSF